MKRSLLSALCLTALTCAAQSTDASKLASAYNDFAFDFFQRIESEHVDENLILSPLSAQFALSMLQNGAAGTTLAEIQQALHTSAFSPSDVNRYNRALINSLQKEPEIEDYYREEMEAQGKNPRDNYSRVEIANGIWVCGGLPVYPDFFATNATYYDASAEQVNFAAPETYARLDQWAYDHTHGLIPSFGLGPDDPNREMVLANALYFEGPWSWTFQPYNTKKARFTNADGSTIETELMHHYGIDNYYHTDNFVMYRLYYGDDRRFYMNLYLPQHDGARLTADEWQQLRNSGEEAEVYFYMPKFCIEDNLSLVDILKGMGVADAFDAKAADFSGITPSPLYVSQVNQKARIEVDEEGTAAAAITYIVNCGADVGPDEEPQRPPRVEIRIDRPFYFSIESRDDNSILFMGHITDLAELERKAGQQSAIEAIPVAPTAHPAYDLQGRPATPGQRGFTIEQGRKVVR